MPLRTIHDLLQQSEEERAESIKQVSSLASRYESWLEADKGDGHKRAAGIHASEVSMCQRKIVYNLRDEEKREVSKNVWKRRFKIGHAVHDMFQKDFEKMAGDSNFELTFQSEVSIKPCIEQPVAFNWQIYSHCDGVFTMFKDGKEDLRVVLEIKTASPDEFDKLKGPKPEHIEQVHVYMACLDIPMAWLLYYNKGNQNFTSADNTKFLVPFDPKKWEELEKRFEAAHTHVHLNTLPDRTEGIVCEFCPFSWTCKPKYLERKAGFHATNKKWSSP